MLISCNQGLGSATTFLTFLYCSRVVARPCTGSRPPSRVRPCVGKPSCDAPHADEVGLGGGGGRHAEFKSACQNSIALRSSSVQEFGMELQKKALSTSMELQWFGGEWQDVLCCALTFWLIPLSTWSRTLRRVYLRALALPVLRYLTLCYACTVCDRRRWIHVLWSQHQRAGAAIRFISRLCTGLRCVDQCWHAAEPSTNLYVAPNLWCSRCTVLATVCNVHSMSSLSSDGVQVVCVGRGEDRAGPAPPPGPMPAMGWVGGLKVTFQRSRTHTPRIPTCAPGLGIADAHTLRTHTHPQRRENTLGCFSRNPITEIFSVT